MYEEIKDTISKSIDENLQYIKSLFENSSDVVYREFKMANKKVLIIYIDGMTDKVLIDDFVIKNLMIEKRAWDIDGIIENVMSLSDLKKIDNLKDGINGVLAGEALMLFDGEDKGCLLALRSWPNKGVGEPSGEGVIRGSREGLTETIRFNTALIRRRIRDTRFKIVPKSIGKRSKTDCAVLYIKDIVNKEALEKVYQRINAIEIDAILDSGYLEQLIEDNKLSLFPQIQSTERPDVVAAALYEGRVAILIDNSPFAIIVPTTLPMLFQAPDDYNQRWMYSTFMRVIRFFSIVLSLIMPALYVAVTSFHTSIIPTKLAYSIATSREGVPFPAFVEALIMEMSMALLMESIVRFPKTIGATIGIVGGLIIGQAAVSAGIVSPIMVIIVSLTTIASFVTSNYEVTFAFRIIRILAIIAASVVGIHGIALILLVILIHLIKLDSFGVPYLSPVVDTNKSDFKDLFFKYPIQYFKNRPKFMKTEDKIRQK